MEERNRVAIPVQVVCGEVAVDGAPPAVYETEIDVAYRPAGNGAESGEIEVAPGILAGEVNPGETIRIRCEDILQGKTAFAGVITVHAYPAEAFVVQVTYRTRGAVRLEGGHDSP